MTEECKILSSYDLPFWRGEEAPLVTILRDALDENGDAAGPLISPTEVATVREEMEGRLYLSVPYVLYDTEASVLHQIVSAGACQFVDADGLKYFEGLASSRRVVSPFFAQAIPLPKQRFGETPGGLRPRPQFRVIQGGGGAEPSGLRPGAAALLFTAFGLFMSHINRETEDLGVNSDVIGSKWLIRGLSGELFPDSSPADLLDEELKILSGAVSERKDWPVSYAQWVVAMWQSRFGDVSDVFVVDPSKEVSEFLDQMAQLRSGIQKRFSDRGECTDELLQFTEDIIDSYCHALVRLNKESMLIGLYRYDIMRIVQAATLVFQRLLEKLRDISGDCRKDARKMKALSDTKDSIRKKLDELQEKISNLRPGLRMELMEYFRECRLILNDVMW